LPEEVSDTVKPVKKVVIALVVIFVVAFVVTQPVNAANVVKAIVDILWNAVSAVGVFFDTLTS
jgi:hypothetical protein